MLFLYGTVGVIGWIILKFVFRKPRWVEIIHKKIVDGNVEYKQRGGEEKPIGI